MNYKGIPHRTIFIEHHHVEARAKELGARPTAVKSWDGKDPFYTLPILNDPNTGATVSDSAAIIEYLDETYPETPRLNPKGCKTFQKAFKDALSSKLGAMWQFALAPTRAVLSPDAQAYFIKRWEFLCGKKFDDILPRGSIRDAEWEIFKNGLGEVDAWFKDDQKFVMEDALTVADLDLVGFLIWLKTIWGVDSTEWKNVSAWHDGRWGELVQNVEQYLTVT